MGPKEALLPWQTAGLTDVKKSWAVGPILSRTANDLTIWLLQHPNFLSRAVLRLLYIVEGLVTNLVYPNPQGTVIYDSRLKHVGPNFCAYAGVVVGEHSEVAKMILSPQKRGPFIAWGEHLPKMYPDHMILFLADKEAGGDGKREEFKDLIVSLFQSPAVLQRSNGPKAKAMVDEFAALVIDISKQKGSETPTLGGSVEMFIASYILYVVLGYEEPDELAKRFATYILPYLKPRMNIFSKKTGDIQPDDKWAYDAIYNAPLLDSIDYQALGLTRDYVARGFMPVFLVAGIPGPSSFLHYALPNLPTDCQLSATDGKTAYQQMLEIMRLNPPVATVTTISQGPFEVNIGGKMQTFPAGTKLCYNMRFASLDPKVFPHPLRFDSSRDNLRENTVNFASVGDRDYGRQCPGRKIAENLGINLFMELGKRGWAPGSVQ